MDGLVKHGHADALPGGDYLIHFGGKIKEADDKPKVPKPIVALGPFERQVDKLGLSGQEAAQYAEEHAARLVTGVDATTIDEIAGAVGQGIRERLGVPGTGRLIRDLVEGMPRKRGETIASTEMNDAMSEATARKLRREGMEFKQIILSTEACDVCEEAADEGPVPIDFVYASGDDRPPFHPNCRCALAAAWGPDEEQ